jgi:hypothetical protein
MCAIHCSGNDDASAWNAFAAVLWECISQKAGKIVDDCNYALAAVDEVDIGTGCAQRCCWIDKTDAPQKTEAP